MSNYCAPLLACVLATARVTPSVAQGMMHVGMGSDPHGYLRHATAPRGIVFVAYSALGGVEGDLRRILASGAVRAAAERHTTTAPTVALAWLAQLHVPMVVLSSSAAHLRRNLRLYDAAPPWGRLRDDEMAALSAESVPGGRPAHWGDCADARLDAPAAPWVDSTFAGA